MKDNMRDASFRGSALIAVVLLVWMAAAVNASIYNDGWRLRDATDGLSNTILFSDSVTGDPARFTAGKGWTIEPGADVFNQELYERPTSQGFQTTVQGAPAFDKYHEALDIVRGEFGLDESKGVAYFAIDLNGQNERTADGSVDSVGFKHFYRIRVSGNADFFGGYMFGVKDPDGNSVGNSFNNSNSYKSTQIWSDISPSWVTGTGITNTGEGTDGYDEFTSEGDSNKIRSRIIGDSVEFAINYQGLGIDPATFDHFIFEATQGLTDPQNYFWNDKYNFNEAGSPYDPSQPPQNIYELDTLKGSGEQSIVPEPASFVSWLVLGSLAGFRRRGARR